MTRRYEDELELLIRPVNSLRAHGEVRRAATPEARGLKRIPPQNTEHDAVRFYVRRLFFLS